MKKDPTPGAGDSATRGLALRRGRGRFSWRRGRGHGHFIFVASCLTLAAATAAAQTPARLTLTLDDAIKLAGEHSESLVIADAGERKADADRRRANSLRLPQVNFAGSYDRTLASEFTNAFGSSSGPGCPPLTVDPTKPLADRVAELERAAGCGAIGPQFDLSSLPFGQRNIFRLTFSFSQAIYAGGRITAQRTLADLSTRSAALTTSTVRAQVTLDVTRAFFDAALSDKLLAIAESSYQQAAAAYDQARLAFEAGRAPEFEQLRARVARDNQQPLVLRRRADRDIAYLRLRQLLELPPTATIVLDVDLDAATLPPPAPFAASLLLASATASSAAASQPTVSVEQAQTLLRVREAGLVIAKAERKPSVNVNSSFGEVGYPSNGFVPSVGDFRTNWTVGALVQMPLFTGGRIAADELAARADLADAAARLKQTIELAELDAATARQDLTAAEAVWAANAGTVQQAQRAYEIAELRYREGISTQLELSDARLLLQSAQANRAQAARDLQVARARLALLPALPAGGR